MKTKITALLMVLASSVFALAEANTDAAANEQGAAPANPPQAAVRKGPQKGEFKRPELTAEQKKAIAKRVLLQLSDDDLKALADEVAAVQKMSAEEKAEAIKALPKPEFNKGAKPGDRKAPPQGANACGPQQNGPQACGQKGAPRGMRGPQQGPQCGAPVADNAKCCNCGCKGGKQQLPPPPPANADAAPAQQPAEEAAAPAAE